jgi:predicted Zn-dependent peptidase
MIEMNRARSVGIEVPSVTTTHVAGIGMEDERAPAVVVVEMPGLHTQVLSVICRGGPRFESPEDNGLTHFVEHMVHRGTRSWPSSKQLSAHIADCGMVLDAATGRQECELQLVLDPADLRHGMQILAEMITAPTLDQIELERAVILEELADDYDDDGTEKNHDDISLSLLVREHPVGQRILGPAENIETFSEADVRRWLRATWCSQNMVICTAGPAPEKQVLEATAAAFTELPIGRRLSQPPPKTNIAPGSRRVPGVVTHIDDDGTAEVNLAWQGFPARNPMRRDYQVALAYILDARLHYYIADQGGLAYSVSAQWENHQDWSVFEVSAETAGSVSDLAFRMMRVIWALCEEGPTDDEVRRFEAVRRRALGALCDAPQPWVMMAGCAALFGARFEIDQAPIKRDHLAEFAKLALRPDGAAVTTMGRVSSSSRRTIHRAASSWSRGRWR